jgi:hypothetical protein
MKRFYVQYKIGKAKYVVCHHDGFKRHLDGSDFFDIAIFKNKKKLADFIEGLLDAGFKPRGDVYAPHG